MGNLTRKDGWLDHLGLEFKRHRELEFSWGVHDCCFAPCDCVKAMTGVDLARAFRWCLGEDDARYILKSYGGVRGVADYMAKQFELESIPHSHVSDGDIILATHGVFGEGLGIVFSGVLYCVSDKVGWSSIAPGLVVKAWRI